MRETTVAPLQAAIPQDQPAGGDDAGTDGTSTGYAAGAAALAGQLYACGAIRSPEVYDAFRTVPRHLAIPRYYRGAAHPAASAVTDPGWRATQVIYSDRSLVTHHQDHDGAASTASRPSHLARVLEAAALASATRVLNVGAGVGYAAALAACVAERATVVALERSEPVARDGADAIDRLGLGGRVHYYCGDGYAGCEPEAPYDRIIVTTGVTGLSPVWLDQLTEDGIIVAPTYVGGLFPLLVTRRADTAGELVGSPALAHADLGPASGLLWDRNAITTQPPTMPMPPAEHTGHVPALVGMNEDDYLALWLYLAVTDPRTTAARAISLDAEERDRAVLIGREGAAAVVPDAIAALGPGGHVLARDAERLVAQWLAAGRPGFDAWSVRLRLDPRTGVALYTPAEWRLAGVRGRQQPVGAREIQAWS